MAENISALNLKITAEDNFTPTLTKLSKELSALNRSGNGSATPLSKIATALEKLNNTGKGVSTNLNKLNNSLGKLPKESKSASSSITLIGTASKKASLGINSLANGIASLGLSMAGFAGKVFAFTGGLKGIWDITIKGIASSMEYVETMNLFTVTMGEYADSAERYATTVGELMGIDPAEWMKGQGTFDALIEGFGIGADAAAYMSQNLTQLAYDIASFENISVEQAMLKIQSGLAGEIEPMRRIGYDLSQARLTEIAQNLENYGNMTYSVNEMTGAVEGFSTALDENSNAIAVNFADLTQADKVQLRYIAMLQEMEFVQGDMARSLEDPANQMRIFKAQMNLVSREIGNIFIPIVNKALPYLIAMAQVLREILSAIASLMGFSLPDMSDRMDVGGAVGGYEDIEDAIDGASGKAKKLKDYMIGIDELNVLRPDDSSGGSGNNSMSAGGASFNLPSYDFIGDATNSRIAQIKAQIEDFLQSIQDGTLRVGEFLGDLFNKFVGLWENPFGDGAKLGQSIANIIEGANDFLKTANTDILGFKLGDWIAGTIQGSDLVYEVASFAINIGTSAIHFLGGFLQGLDLINTTDSFLKQVTEAILAPFSDGLYGGHFENGEWVVTDLNLALHFNAQLYANEHPIVAGLGDWIADLIGIGDRWNKNGEYVVTVPLDVRLDAVNNLINSSSGLNGLFNMARNGTDFFQRIDLGLSDDTRQLIATLITAIIESVRALLQGLQGLLGTFAGLLGFDAQLIYQPAMDILDNIQASVDAFGASAELLSKVPTALRNATTVFGHIINSNTSSKTPHNFGSFASLTSNNNKPSGTAKRDAQQYVNAYVEEMNASKGIFETLGDSVSENFRKGMDNNLYNNMYSTTTKGVQGVIDGANSKLSAITSSANSLKNALTNTVSGDLYNKMYNIGNNGIQGFAKALTDSPAYKQAIENAKQMAKSAVDAVKAELQIHSPSKVMAEVGTYFAEGMATGVKETAPVINKQVATTTQNVAKSVATTTKQTLSKELKIHSPSQEFAELGKYTAQGFTVGFEDEAKNTYKALTDFANTVKNVDTSSVYKPMANMPAPQAIATGFTGAQVDNMANMASMMYEAITSALQSNTGNGNAGNDTKIYINGREIFKVVQEESRKNGVEISNGAFIGG